MPSDDKTTFEVRCPIDQCTCLARNGPKLLARLIDAPRALLGAGCVLQLACPRQRSKVIRIRL